MLKIDAGSAVPVYEQLKRQIKLKVISGKYQPDSKLPSIRQLASELKINPNTIAKVYRQLERENILYSKSGSGFFVKKEQDELNKARTKLLNEFTDEFISKVVELGFSPDTLKNKLSKQIERVMNNDKA